MLDYVKEEEDDKEREDEEEEEGEKSVHWEAGCAMNQSPSGLFASPNYLKCSTSNWEGGYFSLPLLR